MCKSTCLSPLMKVSFIVRFITANPSIITSTKVFLNRVFAIISTAIRKIKSNAI